jgi:light-regulated signal transduction histidine kinase (bacteriophytochrome)
MADPTQTGSMRGLDLLRAGEQVTRTNCDREPIHVPGAIQPHGLLLVLDPETGAIRQASANAEAFLGAPAEAAVGRSVTGWLSERALEELRQVAGDDHPGQLPMPVRVEMKGEVYEAVAHENPAGLVVEFEPAPPESLDRWYGPDPSVRAALAALGQAPSVEALAAVFVREARRLLQIDRVMVYRFSPDWHGEVIAEDHGDVPESFMGLHFPATDIPEPARRLYLRNRVRLIADVGYAPTPVVPPESPVTGAPLDMSDAVLRSVSPFHIEYLQNMGVAASMSVSIVQDGKLWGLLACHHYRPHEVPYRLRVAADLVAQVFAMQLSLKRSETELQIESRTKDVQTRLVEQMSLSEHVIDGLTGESPAILNLLDAAGAAVQMGGALRLLGTTPPEEDVRALLGWVREQAGDAPVWSTDRLPALYPDGEALAGVAAGVLGVSFVGDWESAALWFRPEQAQTVAWGGAPKEPEGVTDGGLLVLKPRNSFAKWIQDVTGRALPWTDGERAAAADLRRVVRRVVLARSEEIHRLNTELERSNAELDAFAYSASHDLKEPLRGINNYAQFLIEDYAEKLGEEGTQQLETIAKLARRLDGFVDALLQVSRLGQVALVRQPVDLDAALQDAITTLRFRLQENDVRVEVPRPLPTVQGDPVRLVDVLTNLLSNAAKYARPGAEGGPTITVGYDEGDEIRPDHRERIGGADRVFWVRDNGIGIQEKHLEHIFGLFKRLHARDAHGGGDGAGLAIVRKVIGRHDGTVWAESAYGEGSAFYFTLSS